MQPTSRAQRVETGLIALTGVLLAGVLTMAYGYLHPNEAALYAGLLLTFGGVVAMVIRVVAQGGGQAGPRR